MGNDPFFSMLAYEYVIGFLVFAIGIFLLVRKKKFNVVFRFIYYLVSGVEPGKNGENITNQKQV